MAVPMTIPNNNCKFYASTGCSRGTHCRFYHDENKQSIEDSLHRLDLFCNCKCLHPVTDRLRPHSEGMVCSACGVVFPMIGFNKPNSSVYSIDSWATSKKIYYSRDKLMCFYQGPIITGTLRTKNNTIVTPRLSDDETYMIAYITLGSHRNKDLKNVSSDDEELMD